MSSFTKPLEYQPTQNERDGRRIFRLTAPFTYELGFIGSDIFANVPVYFETDFASIPFWADDWFGINPTDGFVKKAAVIHDYLYSRPSEVIRLKIETELLIGRKIKISNRHFADRIFYEAMGIPNKSGIARLIQNIKRRSVFIAVRIFGQRFYSNLENSI